MRILVTGTRNRPSKAQLLDLAGRLHDLELGSVVVHGAATGVDTLAGVIADALGLEVDPHPAQWGVHGKAAGPIRNAEMVALGADQVWAYPAPDSRGTFDCVDKATTAGLSVTLIQ